MINVPFVKKLDDSVDYYLPTYSNTDDNDEELFKDDNDGNKQQQDGMNDDDTSNEQPHTHKHFG